MDFPAQLTKLREPQGSTCTRQCCPGFRGTGMHTWLCSAFAVLQNLQVLGAGGHAFIC